MPNAGDPCGRDDAVDFDPNGEVLVCRSGIWQYVGQAPPPMRPEDLRVDPSA